MSLKNIAEMRRYEKFLRSTVKSTTDYNYKSLILKCSLTSSISKISRFNHLNIVSEFTGEYCSMSDSSVDFWFDSLAQRFGFCAILEAERINHATFERTRRLRRRVESIVSYPCLFLTLTFTNKVLSTTSKETRRRYVSRFLHSVSFDYVANIDYGSRNGREHYHALVLSNSIDYSLWPYGSINFEKVHNDNNCTSEKLSQYISKLTNHAIKKTCRREHLIYPKKKS